MFYGYFAIKDTTQPMGFRVVGALTENTMSQMRKYMHKTQQELMMSGCKVLGAKIISEKEYNKMIDSEISSTTLFRYLYAF